MSHSPAPWTVVFAPDDDASSDFDGRRLYYIQDATGEDLVITDSGVYPPGEADARLMAAAPDLLVACKMALNDRMFKEWPEIATALMQAIAKAEGK